ncbi:SecDF P1 head subdomain-containing protein [Pollutimonas harenae]|uniref:SecDF P1 head subdomain domain-containing protein n=1 Tax=Pollutimonas harenae TaxID=657015 RepID=A0A853H6T4_9BURK|nr:hypothetical protein [Pollutimonas harenae]NYT85814.1 hypothetical protein [Pollutimonas harenae]TEA70873.1 hypothetical protein ERD84_09455 [Pollutimonas harenae]
MKTVGTLGRILVPLSLVLLAACQNMPGKKTTETANAPEPETSIQAQQQGAPVAVFLADTVEQSGWTSVNVQGGSLFVNPQPIVTRADLSGIQAGANKDGEGLLALELNDAGKAKVAKATTDHPNKRLALVVGRTMLAAPGYSSPVTTGQLVFAVGTEQNATAAARAIAGAPPEGAQSTTPSTTGNTSSTGGTQ